MRGNLAGDAQILLHPSQGRFKEFPPGGRCDRETCRIDLPAFAHRVIMDGPGPPAVRGGFGHGDGR